MVTRNFPMRDAEYVQQPSQPLHHQEDDREYLNLDELKPHRFTELGAQVMNNLDVDQQHLHPTHTSSENQNTHNSSGSTVDHPMRLHHHRSPFDEVYQPGSDGLLLHHEHYHPYFDPNAQPSHQSNESSCMQYIHEMTTVHHQQSQSDRIPSLEHQIVAKSPKMHPPENSPTCIGGSRKRKNFYAYSSDFGDETSDDSKSVRTTDENKKQNHSEIEKRRRDKMNLYITELSAMIPMCTSMSRKLDKLTVLRMAVQHLKSIRGAVNSYTEGQYKPAFLSEKELKMLILQAADGFLFVVGCDRGRILYVSESVSSVLNYTQQELLGQSWFDVVHPKDVPKVKEQLSSSDLNPREKFIDAKTMLPVRTDEPQDLTRLCPGARRSFFCRMKFKPSASTSSSSHHVKEESGSDAGSSAVGGSKNCGSSSGGSTSRRRKPPSSSDKKYCVIQCTGYLKSWAPTLLGVDEQEPEAEGESCNMSCLVAIGRIPPYVFEPDVKTSDSSESVPVRNVRSIQFMSRHAVDGKFLFVDQRATLVLGFLPQELLGTSMYEYYHHDDIATLADCHKTVLQTAYKITTNVYQFRSKEQGFVRLQSEWKSFRNPWTKEIEYLMAKNSVIFNDSQKSASNMNMQCYRVEGSPHVTNNFDFFNQSNGRDMQQIITTHLEASKIGQQVADQAMDFQRRIDDSSADNSPLPTEEQASSSNHPQLSSGDNSTSGGEMPPARYISSPHNQHHQVQRSTGHGGAHSSSLTVLGQSLADSPDQDTGSNLEIVRLMGSSTNPEAGYSGGPAAADGNDEAAMAVIMSLLEADAGLGGTVDYTGLPWPLPKTYF